MTGNDCGAGCIIQIAGTVEKDCARRLKDEKEVKTSIAFYTQMHNVFSLQVIVLLLDGRRVERGYNADA